MAQPTSTETILTFKRNDDQEHLSDWSIVWSTHQVPGMDMATGGGSVRRRKSGRRRLRLAALTLGGLLTMHARVSAAALTGGYFVFVLLLLPTVYILANSLRHFEVYLGQWSISGPGRAFRIIPMFDGIGIAICIHVIIRAIISVVMAALAGIFVMDSVSDRRLPFTYCRDMNLKQYEATTRYIDSIDINNLDKSLDNDWPGSSLRRAAGPLEDLANSSSTKLREYDPVPLVRRTTLVCNEKYPNNYPPLYRTTAYNYFYVEVIHYRSDHSLTTINLRLLIAIMVVWVVIWVAITIEKYSYGRMIWNNMWPWFVLVPWCWSGLLIFTGTRKLFSRKKPLRNIFHVGGHKDVLDFTSDVFMVGTYIHAAALGSELIHGKGLNHYASGHIDPDLNSENLWHSAMLMILAALSAGGASLCGLTDFLQMRGVSTTQESTLWLFPLIAKCAIADDYSHLMSTLLFSGLLFSYGTVAFVCIKTAIHIIFEYKVKLVFVEQSVVAVVMLFCMGASVVFTTNASLGLLESLDVFMVGIATPLISALEMLGLLYVYRSHDFMSDMNIATEDNVCSERFGILWQILPFLQLLLLILEAVLIANSELPGVFLYVGVTAVCILLLALPLRACHNVHHFLQPPKPR